MHSKGEAGYFDPLDTPGLKVACLVWDCILGGRGLAVGWRPTSINLWEGTWVYLVVFQPWSHPAFRWCEHMDGAVSDENLEVPVVFTH